MKVLVLLSLVCMCYGQQFQLPLPPMEFTRLGEDGTSSITEHYRNDNVDSVSNEGAFSRVEFFHRPLIQCSSSPEMQQCLNAKKASLHLMYGSANANTAEANQGNYDFGYNEGHNEGGTFRRERGDAYGRKYGTYGYTNNEGLIRIVNYVADENGFRAEFKSTEPGVDEKEPASVIVFKEDTPTLMTYPGPEAASVPDADGNIPGLPAAASAPIPYAFPANNAQQPLVMDSQRLRNGNSQHRN